MKFIKGLLLALLALAALTIGILFSSRNSAPVAVDMLVVQLPPMSVALWILVSFTLGAIASGLVYALINQAHKRRNKRLLSQVNQLQAVRETAK
jgi:putative membrane protein